MILSNVEIQAALDAGDLVIEPEPGPGSLLTPRTTRRRSTFT